VGADGQDALQFFNVTQGLLQLVDFFSEQSLIALEGYNHEIECLGGKNTKRQLRFGRI
jgi:hypothetical protein